MQARASVSDTSILNGIGIDEVKIGSTYEIAIFSSSCHSRGRTVLKISRDDCGYGLVGDRSTNSKYEKRKIIRYKIISLSSGQLDSLRSFELILAQQIRLHGALGSMGCAGRSVYSITQEGQTISFNDSSCESKFYPTLKAPLIEEAE